MEYMRGRERNLSRRKKERKWEWVGETVFNGHGQTKKRILVENNNKISWVNDEKY